MQIQNVLAHVDVVDFDLGVAWYERLLGRGPDRRPMENLAEWQLTDTAGLQVYRRRTRAPATVVIAVDDDVDAVAREVGARGLALEVQHATTGRFDLGTITDPFGNVITFAHAVS